MYKCKIALVVIGGGQAGWGRQAPPYSAGIEMNTSKHLHICVYIYMCKSPEAPLNSTGDKPYPTRDDRIPTSPPKVIAKQRGAAGSCSFVTSRIEVMQIVITVVTVLLLFLLFSFVSSLLLCVCGFGLRCFG